MKNIRYFCNGTNTIEWNMDECSHSGKCFKNIPYYIEKQGIYKIDVSDRQFKSILSQLEFCPEKALKLQETK